MRAGNRFRACDRGVRRRPLLLAAGLWLATGAGGWAQETVQYFQQNCASCHTVGGGRLVGPDLKNVSERKDRDWLTAFIVNPQSKLGSGDPYALKILEEARGVPMPNVAGITRERAVALLDLIDAESKLEKSQFAGVQISDRPFTDQDRALGQEYFVGTKSLSKSGPACIACHTVRGLGGLGGGRLGPDLTKVYERIGGRRPLSAWLVGPATTTMQPIFRNNQLTAEEILPLVSFFEQAAQQPAADDAVNPLNFFLIGVGGMALGLVAFDGVWKRRFRAVRRPLVDGFKVGTAA